MFRISESAHFACFHLLLSPHAFASPRPILLFSGPWVLAGLGLVRVLVVTAMPRHPLCLSPRPLSPLPLSASHQLDLPFRVRAVGVENVCGQRSPVRFRLKFSLTAGGFLMDNSTIVTSVADGVAQTWDGVVSHGARWHNGFQASGCNVSSLTVVRVLDKRHTAFALPAMAISVDSYAWCLNCSIKCVLCRLTGLVFCACLPGDARSSHVWSSPLGL